MRSEMNVNNVVLSGILVDLPQFKTIGKSELSYFVIEYSRNMKKKDGTVYVDKINVDCEAWGFLANKMKGCKKSQNIIVNGKIKVNEWKTEKDNFIKKRYVISVDSVDFDTINTDTNNMDSTRSDAFEE